MALSRTETLDDIPERIALPSCQVRQRLKVSFMVPSRDKHQCFDGLYV
jgi:hypothetical protein